MKYRDKNDPSIIVELVATWHGLNDDEIRNTKGCEEFKKLSDTCTCKNKCLKCENICTCEDTCNCTIFATLGEMQMEATLNNFSAMKADEMYAPQSYKAYKYVMLNDVIYLNLKDGKCYPSRLAGFEKRFEKIEE